MLKVALALIFSIVVFGQTSSYNGLGNSSPYTDTGSIVWAADNGCTTSTQFTVNNTITGTNDPTLYQHGRLSTSAFSCTYSVTNSLFYTITLKFANTQNFTTGQRIFNIFINNALVRANFDLAATAPANTAFDLGFVIPVSTGQVIINLQPIVGGVLLNAIGITAIAPGTLTSNNSWTGTNSFTGQMVFSGGNPWLDVTGSNFGAKCDGSTDDTTAITSAINQATTNGGGTVYTPVGKTCVIASQINITTPPVGIKIIGGFGTNAISGNLQTTWKFTGTCAAGACLSITNGVGVTFSGIGLLFSGATTAPAMDISGATNYSFHGIAFGGPSAASTLAPLILNSNSNGVSFDSYTTFNNAGVFVRGPSSNSIFSDTTTFDRVTFLNPTIAAIQNASVNWTVRESIYQMFVTGTTCAPFLQYVGGYTNEQNFLAAGNVFNTGGNNCTNTFSLFSFPAASGNLGGVTFISNLIITGTSAGNQTTILMGAGQSLMAHSNNIEFAKFAFDVSAGTTSVNIGPGVYSNITTPLNGTPTGGTFVDNNGALNVYGTTNLNVSLFPTVAQAGQLNLGGATQPFFSTFVGNSANNTFQIKGTGATGNNVLSLASTAAVTPTWTLNSSNGTPILGTCSTSQKTETAADTNLLTCAIPAVVGSYRIRFILSLSAANTATLGWTATWTDSNGAAQTPTNLALFQSGTAAPALTFTTSAVGNFYGYADIDVNNAGISPVVKLTFSGTSFTGKASATVERII